MDEITFELDGEKYKIRKPTTEELRYAKKVYAKTFIDAVEADSPLQVRTKELLTKQKLWNAEKEAEYEAMRKEMNDLEYVLEMNPQGIKKAEARAVAIKMRQLRVKVNELTAPISQFNIHTAEGQAESAKFDYLFSLSVLYDDGRQYFSNFEDYLNRPNDKIIAVAASKFAEMFYGVLENLQAAFTENQFLLKYGYSDDKFRLVDSKNRLIDEEGKLINEDGLLIDEDGDLIDVNGHKIDEKGNFIGVAKPFLD